MKKLQKLQKGFAALENKGMSNLQTVFGGAATSRCSEPTNGNTDTAHYKDGVHVGTSIVGPLE